jgi:hypothetical protein
MRAMEAQLQAPPAAATVSVSERLRGAARSPWAGVLLAAAVIALMVQPMVIGRTFIGFDWYAHLWYVEHAEQTLKDHWLPSLYAHNTLGVFDPHYAFYGGTLYMLAGVLSLLSGSPEHGFVLSWALGFAGAYGGWYWLARQAGVGRWPAHIPGILFVTSPYYLATIYAGASWGELMTVAAIPLLMASALAVLRDTRLRPWPAAALAISTIVATGSHNLTLLWAATVLAAFTAVTLAVTPAARRLVTRAGLRRLAVVAIPALAVNAWFLLPDLVLAGRTAIAHDSFLAAQYLHSAMHMLEPDKLLSLGRASNEPRIPHYSLQLPLLAVGWVVLGLAVAWSGWRAPWWRVVVVLLAIIVPLSVLMTQFDWLVKLPKPWGLLQFGFRLEAYILIGAVGAVVAVLALAARAGRRGRIWTAVLVPVALVSVVQGFTQIHQDNPKNLQLPPWPSERPHHTPAFAPGSGDYAALRLNVFAKTSSYSTARFSPVAAERTGRTTATVQAFPGQVVRSNLIAVPDLVKLKGATFFGRDADGAALLSLTDDAGSSGTARITAQAARPWPVPVGAALSVLGLLGLAALGVALLRRERRTPGG